jgi:hypothetical protein
MTPDSAQTFVEVDHFQIPKHRQSAPGDVFHAARSARGGRLIVTLSDGLGSGVKAGVLATLTATMMTRFALRHIPLRRAAEIVMDTLPVSKELGISYATFTSVDIHVGSSVRIAEYDNPPYILLRNGAVCAAERQRVPFARANKETGPETPTLLYHSAFPTEPGDRIIFFSDGVTQAGIGGERFPGGWGRNNALLFILDALRAEPEMSARELAQAVVREAEAHDGGRAHDDISCGAVYFRHPSDLLVLTGPPWREEHDKTVAALFRDFSGRRVISGGTTAQIVARELGLSLATPRGAFSSLDSDEPAEMTMEGADMVTEGILTLAAVARLLERGADGATPSGTVRRMTDLLLGSDRIFFVVGTKVNDANYDPALPVELEVRRTVVKRIAALLEAKHLKETRLQFF